MKSSPLTLAAARPAAAAPLRLVAVEPLGLRVATVRNRHDEILYRDQVLGGQVVMRLDDLGTTFVAILLAYLRKFFANDAQQAIGVGQNI